MRSITSFFLTIALVGAILTLNSCTQQFCGFGEEVEGQIIDREQGKDGYSATLRTSQNEEFHITVSMIHLRKRYLDVAVGDNVAVRGDQYDMGREHHITVSHIELR